ncbi:MAG: transglycosylase domain-containing protein [Bacteroidota bacterium]
MRTKKQKIFLFLKCFVALLVLLMALALIFRDAILQKVVSKAQSKLATEYNCTLNVGKASFEGFSGVNLNNITLVPKDADSLLSVEKIKAEINVLQLFTGTIQLQKLEMSNGFVQFVKTKQGNNFDAFINKEKQTDVSDEKQNYAKITYSLLSRLLNLIPTDMQLNNLSLRMDDLGRKVTLQMNELVLKNQQLKSTINVNSKNVAQNWSLQGFADPRNRKADLSFFNNDTAKIKLPYIDERFNILSSFDSIHLNVEKIEMEDGELHVDGYTSISNFTIKHKRISSKPVVIEKARFDYHLLFGHYFVAIDSSSTVQLNQIKMHPFAEYNIENDTVYKLGANIPKMKAQDFITSLPKGLFTNFVGMEAEGDFDYKLTYNYNKNKPKDIVFDSKINKENLRITKYGQANLSKLNGTFTYRAVDNGVLQRPIIVGRENPNYTPWDEISFYLQKAVLTSEDPSFFSHKGFINEAFKQSILKNIKTSKFTRGASTISMQLIKNVFLTREKTLSRKLEEILLVYILENNRIVSKQRMLEVYFNVIEWGPNVYGIGEASQFYFQKTPAYLSLKECLFLASIVPSPKNFMRQLDDDGNLRPNAKKNQTFIKNLMMRRGVLTAEDTIGESAPVHVTGRARSFFKVKIKDDEEEKQSKEDSIFEAFMAKRSLEQTKKQK